jgi:alcohol dehydrogenase (NADP+)
VSSGIDPKSVPQVSLASGEKIPGIGMGTFGSDKYSPASVAAAVSGAIRYGYRAFDCASVYGNEDLIGGVFEEAFTGGAVRREELFITSKLWNNMHGRGDVLLSLAKTLRDLRLDQVDAYLVHWPIPNYHAPGCDGDARNPDSTPFSAGAFLAVWAQMEKIADMGLAEYIGMSNMTIPKLEAVLPRCAIQPALIEMELHPGFQQPELFEYCVKRGIVVVGYCPIGSPTEKNYQANLRCVTEDPLSAAEMEAIGKADKLCRLVKGQVFLWSGAKGWEDLWD